MRHRIASLLLWAIALGTLLLNPNAASLAAEQPDASAAADAANAFAWDMFGQLRQEAGNLFFSPYSIHAALAMTSAGARSHTAEEMRDTLRLGGLPNDVHPALGALRSAVEADKDAPYELAVANALWGQAGFGFHNAFLDALERHYGAGLKRVDFEADPDGSRERVNAWVAEKTRDRIRDILPRSAVTRDTRLALANAIYFKGDWAEQFDEERTEEAPFHRAPGDEAEAPFMRQRRRFPYAETDSLQALALPYAGDGLEMVVLLPKEKDGLTGVEEALDSEELDGLFRRRRSAEVEVWLPRFTMTRQYSLKPTLEALGMRTAFTARADFTGISGDAPLKIDAAVHKAFVEVNEEGTEAAAATAVSIGIVSITVPTEPVVFRADRPFLFLVRHVPTGAILFMGRVADPTM